MGWYDVCKLIRDLYVDEEVRIAFRKSPQDVVKRYRLSDDEREALVRRDYVALHKMGIPPLLVFHFFHVVEEDRELYVKEVVPKLRELGLS